MEIRKVIARAIKDSRKQFTIEVVIKTSKGKFTTSAPSGKSTGKYEVKPYAKGLKSDMNIINSIDIAKLNGFLINKFQDLVKLEKYIGKNIGGNSLFALEASILKALAKENNQELWEFLRDKKFSIPYPVGNTIGGGLHSKGKEGVKPNFQEFLFIAAGKTFEKRVKVNKMAYKITKKMLGTWKRNDEGAWETNLTDEQILEIMVGVKKILSKKYNYKVEIGLDVAASSFYKNKQYTYKNPRKILDKKGQISYLRGLIKKYKIFYLEDGLEECDFSGFSQIRREKCFIVGDDLTTTNPQRLRKAILKRSINAIIVKPNQIGSLLKVKRVIDMAKAYNLKTVISHRSGETIDNTIADLAVGWNCDFIKTGTYGKVRKSKLNRLIEIEKKLKNK